MARLARRQPIARLARCGAAVALVASAAAARPADAEAPAVQVVPLRLVEWRLSPQALTIAPGTTVRFVVANEGALAHALAVEGEGVYAETSAIGSGETATLDLTFTLPGVYDLYCPLSYGQHRALGQEAVLIVGAAAPSCAGSSPCLASSGEAPGTMEGAAPPAESVAEAAGDTAPPAESASGAAEDAAGEVVEATLPETPDGPAPG